MQAWRGGSGTIWIGMMAGALLLSIHGPRDTWQLAHGADPPRSEPNAPIADPNRLSELATRLDSIVDQRLQPLTGSHAGIAVLDVQSGAIVYERDGEGLYNTASNTKLITATAALSLLGSDFQFYTALYGPPVDPQGQIKGDLYIRGRGDPTLGTRELYAMARDLRLLGAKRVTGKIVVDTSYFDDQDLPPHFDEDPEDQASFRAPIASTSLNFNSVAIQIVPDIDGTSAAAVRAEPPNEYVKIDSLVETVATGRTRIRIETAVEKQKTTFTVRGQIRADDRMRSYRRRIANPQLYVGSALREALRSQGIQVASRRIGTGEVPPTATALASHSSDPLAVVLRGLGKYSNNFVAEMLLKTIGAESRTDTTVPTTWEHGLSAVRTWLETTVGFANKGYYYGNGSGLYESNRFSARQMVSMLALAYRDFRIGPDLQSSLAIAGVDGTLRSRMAETDAEKRVRAKTGTLDGVSCLSGYIALDGISPLAFAIFVNGYGETGSGIARRMQNEVAEALVQFLRKSP